MTDASQVAGQSSPGEQGLVALHGVGEVVRTWLVTPGVRRVTLTSDAVRAVSPNPAPMEGRIYFPLPGETEPLMPDMDQQGMGGYQGRIGDVTRPWSVRSLRLDDLEIDLDFVVHEGGLASPWAEAAAPGDRLGFSMDGGMEGAWVAPDDVALQVLVGDETALPGLAAKVEHASAGTRIHAIVEVDTEAEQQPFDTDADLTVTWLYRRGAPPGTTDLLARAVREFDWPGDDDVYINARAETKAVGEIRRFVRESLGLGRRNYFVMAYWRRGVDMTKNASEGIERLAAMVAEGANLFDHVDEILG
jgi:NADPH-dependent ferric siderophore reductase